MKLSCKGWDYNTPQPIYNLITVLRVRAMGVEEKKVADSMEHHLDKWKAKEGFKEKYKVVVDYALNTLKLDMTEDDILSIITNSYTNDFSHSCPSGNQVTVILFARANLFLLRYTSCSHSLPCSTIHAFQTYPGMQGQGEVGDILLGVTLFVFPTGIHSSFPLLYSMSNCPYY